MSSPVIEYNSDAYPEKRNIINKTRYQYVFRKRNTNDIRYILRRWMQRFSSKRIPFNVNTTSYYLPINRDKKHFLHTFNQVALNGSHQKWCVTFESTVPRTKCTVDRPWEIGKDFKLDLRTRILIHQLCKDNCIACIALSECALKIQQSMLGYISESQRNILNSKLRVIHPPQAILISEDEIHEKYSNMSRIEFIFVGGDFFRKGGQQLIEALQSFVGIYEFHLTIISSLNHDEYASHSNSNDTKAIQEIIKNTEWITWYEHLDNSDVLEICKNSHIGCLPTLADTYGYSVLEMQACGIPVITTNVRALPEINNNDCGWIVELSLRNSGEATIETKESSDNCKSILLEGITNSLTSIFRNPSSIEDKALKSWNRIKTKHDPDEYGKKLLEIYNS